MKKQELLRAGDTLEIRKGEQPGMICHDACGYDARTISSMIDSGYTVFVERKGKPPARVTRKLLKEMTT